MKHHLLVLLAFLLLAGFVADSKAAVILNEIDYDQVGSDTMEFIELFNDGSSAVDISGYLIGLINGNNDQFYDVYTIPTGTTIAAGGYYVLGSSNLGVLANQNFSGTTDRIQNGSPDAVALYSGGTIVNGNPSGTTNIGNLLDGIDYEETAADVVNYPGFAWTPSSLSDSSAVNISLGRSPNGSGAWTLLTSPTPGTANAEAVPEPSRALLLLLGAMGIFGRRRRQGAV